MILYKVLYNWFEEVSVLCITENKDVSFETNFAFGDRSSVRSLIYAIKRRGPKIDPWGTAAVALTFEKSCSFKVTLCFLSFEKTDKILSSLPKKQFCFSLKKILLSLDIEKNASYFKPVIKRLFDRIQITGASWLETRLVWVNQFVSIGNLKISSDFSLSGTFPQNGSIETSR